MSDHGKLRIVRLVGTIFCASIALFGFFVWPTQYEYTREAPNVWRVNRFSGIRESSTADGWKTDRQIQIENEAKKELADKQAAEDEKTRRAADAAHFKELLAGRDLAAKKFGPGSSYSAEVRIAFTSSKALVRIVVAPYNGSLRDAVDRGSPIGNLQLLSDSQFVLHELPLDAGDFTRVVNDKGGFSSLTTQKEIIMTEADYQQIKDFAITWRF